MEATGDAAPAKAAIPVTDLMTGMYAHGAILAAVHRGVGDKIDCDLLSTQLAMLFNLGSNYLNAGNGKRFLNIGLLGYRNRSDQVRPNLSERAR